MDAVTLAAIMACGPSSHLYTASMHSPLTANPSSTGFVWGVQGHPGKQAAYAASGEGLSRQFDYLDGLQASYYRIDLYPDTAGNVDPAFGGILDGANARGIRILPLLVAAPEPNASDSANYHRGYAMAFNFAARYRGRFSHVEAGNELDNRALKFTVDSTASPHRVLHPDGSSIAHYVDSLLPKTTAFLRGMTEGIHEGAPGTGVIINVGFRHYAFLEALHRDSVPFDVYGYHWYSDMGDFASDVLPHLPDQGKDIWITEANWKNTSESRYDPVEQGRWIAQFAREVSAIPRVKALFIYELLEERAFGLREPEAWYGIVGCSDEACSGRRTLKPGFYAYREAILESRRDTRALTTLVRHRADLGPDARWRTDGRVDGWTGGRTDGWTDGGMDSQSGRPGGLAGGLEGSVKAPGQPPDTIPEFMYYLERFVVKNSTILTEAKKVGHFRQRTSGYV